MSEYVDFQNALALAIASGIGGDGEMMVQETLWEGTIKTNNTEVSLSKSINNYDIIAIISGKTTSPQNQLTPSYFLVSNILIGVDDNIHVSTFVSHEYNGSVTGKFSSDKKFLGRVFRVSGWTEFAIHKIIGIKFTGTKSVDYSTEEQVIGKWIDGKPLYQKTVEYTSPTGRVTDRAIFEFSNITIRSLNYNNNNYTITDGSYSRFIYPNAAGTKIIYNQGSAGAVATYYITIQYTKTTD